MEIVEKSPTPPGQNPNAEEPEIPFTKEWGALVRRARVAKGLSQQTLADMVGGSQPQITQVEGGGIGGSRLVMPIVRALGIPSPAHYFTDEMEQRWVESGRVLRRLNEPGFKGLLAAAELMIANSEPSEH